MYLANLASFLMLIQGSSQIDIVISECPTTNCHIFVLYYIYALVYYISMSSRVRCEMSCWLWVLHDQVLAASSWFKRDSSLWSQTHTTPKHHQWNAFTLSLQYKHFLDAWGGHIIILCFHNCVYYRFVLLFFSAPAFSDKMSPNKALTMKDYENVSVLVFSSQ